MAWNPGVLRGGNGGSSPRDMLRKLLSQLGGGGSRGGLLLVLSILALLVGVFTSYYQVEPDEVGVIRRLGRFVGTIEPGPALPAALRDRARPEGPGPAPAQDGVRLPHRSARRRRPRYRSRPPRLGRESLMLTGDLNVAVVEWIVQYKIKDPYAFLFKVRNVDETLRIALRGDDALGGRRPLGQRGAHHRPPEGRHRGQGAAPAPGRPLRRPAWTSSRWCSRTSTRPTR